MKKSVLLILGLILSACGPANGATEGGGIAEESSLNPTETPAESTATQPRPTPVPTQTAGDGSNETQFDESQAELSDSVVPARTLSEANVVRESDHVKGATDPLVTIIEYGDFQ